MPKKTLDDRILQHLIKKLSKHNPQSIQNAISGIRLKYGVTSNAAAKEYARKNNIKIDRWINENDLKSWQSIPKDTVKTKTVYKTVNTSKTKKITEYVQFDTNDRFISGHINEINICCTYGAYTAAFILCRKVVENLLIKIILKKYPLPRDNIPLYFDPPKNRTKDLSEILKNLNQKKNDFGADKSLLESLLSKAIIFKDEANKKTHSSYHLVRCLKDLEIENLKDILEMLKTLDVNLSKNT